MGVKDTSRWGLYQNLQKRRSFKDTLVFLEKLLSNEDFAKRQTAVHFGKKNMTPKGYLKI